MSANKEYIRCEYISPTTNEQCEVWFPFKERKFKDGHALPVLCDDCAKSPNASATPQQKTQYIETINIQRKFCENMTLDELDVHIAKITAAIEDQKVCLNAARAVRADRISKLSDEERNERRKYKIQKALNPEKVKSVKKDPVAALSNKLGSEQKAKDLLSLDPDEFIKKYQAKKEQRQ